VPSASVIEAFADADLSDEQRWYLAYNSLRYEHTLERVREFLANGPESPLILDVGPSYQTQLLRWEFPHARVDQIGYGMPFELPPGSVHHTYDLLNTRFRERWLDLDDYDIVVMSEVIEHLWTGPVGLLEFLGTGLKPTGHLIVQTPNAVALHKRIEMLLGRNPILPLPEGDCPGRPHLHEYTLRELTDAARQAGLEVAHVWAANYFGTGRAASAYHALGRILPRTLRHGFTITFRLARSHP
jgi:SAM-dependent methyltransferase